jgi:hypothetical protein
MKIDHHFDDADARAASMTAYALANMVRTGSSGRLRPVLIAFHKNLQ